MCCDPRQVQAHLVLDKDIDGISPAVSQPTISLTTVYHQSCYSHLVVQDFRKVLAIFTLEDVGGQVLGEHLLPAKNWRAGALGHCR